MIDKWILFAIASMLFIAAFQTMLKVTSEGIDYGTAILLINGASFVAAFAVFGFAKVQGVASFYTIKSVISMLIIGASIGVLNVFLFLSYKSGPLSQVAPILGIAPGIMVLIGYFALNESINMRTGIGIGLALIAIYLIGTGG